MVDNSDQQNESSQKLNSAQLELEKRLLAEADWLQRARAGPVFEQLKGLLTDCCRRLNAQYKCADAELANEPRPKPPTEKFQLQPRGGLQESSLNAVVTLCGDNVVQAEVSLKYAKSASGFYRATAQPSVHWKMSHSQSATTPGCCQCHRPSTGYALSRPTEICRSAAKRRRFVRIAPSHFPSCQSRLEVGTRGANNAEKEIAD